MRMNAAGLIVLVVLALQLGCQSIPENFEGRGVAVSQLIHKPSQFVFPSAIATYARKNDTITHYGNRTDNYSVGYVSGYYAGLPQRATIYIYKHKGSVSYLTQMARDEIKANREKDNLPVNNFATAAYSLLGPRTVRGERSTFESKVVYLKDYGIGSAIKEVDTYEEVWIAKGKDWVLKIRLTGPRSQEKYLPAQFETFVKTFLDQQSRTL